MIPGFRTILIILLGILQFSCERRTIREQADIFDLEKFIDEQIEELAEGKYELQKLTVIDDSVERATVTHDSAGWTKELSIFKTADIHKPGLRDYYERSVISRNGNRIEKYTLRDTSESRTLYLTIIYREDSRAVSQVKAAQQTNNPIYQSKRDLFIGFKRLDDQGILMDTFSIKGFQKMVMQDSVNYFSAGKLIP